MKIPTLSTFLPFQWVNWPSLSFPIEIEEKLDKAHHIGLLPQASTLSFGE